MTPDEIKKANPIVPFLRRKGIALFSGNTRAQRCPIKAHDRKDAVSIDAEKDLYHCFVCNDGGDIIKWEMVEKGLTFEDACKLFDPRFGEIQKAAPVSPKPAVSEPEPVIVATFDFTDEQGNVLFQEVKYQPKSFKQRRSDGNGGWIWNMEGARLVPYRLADVIAAQEVWIVEGPKDCEAMRAAGFTATTNPMGAGKWKPEFNEFFKGKTVFIVPDNDESGRKHAEQVRVALEDFAEAVYVVKVDGPLVKDASDFIAAFPSAEDAAVELRKRADAAAGTPSFDIRPLSEFEVEDKEHDHLTLLGNRYLCRGGALLLVAPSGIGKSVVVMQSAILWSLERNLFGIKPRQPIKTVIIQAENDDGDIAEMRDGIYKGLELRDDEMQEAGNAVQVVCESSLTGDKFIALVKALLKKYKPDLLIIDPLFAYLGESVSDQAAVSKFLRNGLNPLLQKYGAALILVHHTNKPAKGKEAGEWKAGDFAYLGSGTNELANWARAVIAIRSIGSHDVFEVILGKRGKRSGVVDEAGDSAMSFHIAHSKQGICWMPATEDDIKSVESDERRMSNEAKVQLLCDAISDCPRSTQEIQKHAMTELGMGKSTFYRHWLEARKRLYLNPSTDKWEGR